MALLISSRYGIVNEDEEKNHQKEDAHQPTLPKATSKDPASTWSNMIAVAVRQNE